MSAHGRAPRDPARATLDYARAENERHTSSALSALVRHLCGGVSWNDERTRRHRSDLERALADRAIIMLAIAELDVIDGKVTP